MIVYYPLWTKCSALLLVLILVMTSSASDTILQDPEEAVVVVVSNSLAESSPDEPAQLLDETPPDVIPSESESDPEGLERKGKCPCLQP